MTYTPSATRAITFTSTSGTTLITSAGHTYGTLTFNGTGGTFQFQDDVNFLSGGTLTLTAGTLDGNSKNVTGGLFTSSGGTLSMGSTGTPTWTMNGTVSQTQWTTGASTTISANTANIVISATGFGTRTFAGAGKTTYNTLTINANAAGTTSITGANTFANLVIGAGNVIRFPSGSTTTITNAFNVTGSSSTPNLFMSSALGTATATIAASGGGTITWTGFRDLTFTGSPTATSSFDQGNNSGITISVPSGGGGGHIIGG
jgi:hypothetical protein